MEFIAEIQKGARVKKTKKKSNGFGIVDAMTKKKNSDIMLCECTN